MLKQRQLTRVFIMLCVSLCWLHANAQTTDSLHHDRKKADSIYIDEFEEHNTRPKILHAEPLYVDLIRDLGARKGEKEWNLGFGLTDNNEFDIYTALVEYEFAPIDRLGLEVELPFTFYAQNNAERRSESIPSNRLNSLKLAAQYTFLVSEEAQTSLAIGYIHEFEFNPFKLYASKIWTGNVYNPFFIAAKRWGNNFHSLVYTGPVISRHFGEKLHDTYWQVNSNVHYMIPGTRNFIGIEFNKELSEKDFDMTIRPQLRVSIADNLMVGIVTGIPISRENQRFSSFVRLIYEPKHKHR